jgi:hypothetical protein
MRGPGSIFFFGVLPAIEDGLEVALEYRAQIVSRVELADVLNAA